MGLVNNQLLGCICCLLLILVTLVASCVATETDELASVSISSSPETVSDGDGGADASSASCESLHNDRFLLFVSTLDGKMSALNVVDQGVLQWTLDTGSRPLVSASISSLQVKKNGVATRLIPSLDGGLYQLDDEGIEALPLSAESLLSSSFRFGDDATIVGAKTTETYGVDTDTGELKYICSPSGCRQFAEKGVMSAEYNVLVIQRNTNTIRAVALSAGEEKWNYSVSEHDIAYISMLDVPPETSSSGPDSSSGEQDGARVDTEEDGQKSESKLPHRVDMDDIEFKVVVPLGVVFAMSKLDPSHVIWQYKFSAAIANAWTLKRDRLAGLDLFDRRLVPALDFDDSAASKDQLPPGPLLYIGRHDDQLYVQPSVLMLDRLQDAAEETIRHGSIIPLNTLRRVNWKPYLASAPSRTPALPYDQIAPRVGWERLDPLRRMEDERRHDDDDDDDDDGDDGDGDGDGMSTTDVSIWHEEYPYDSGFYLFPDFTPFQLTKRLESLVNVSRRHPSVDLSDRASFWSWWKEVAAFSLLTSVFVHVLIAKLVKLKSTEGTSSSSAAAGSGQRSSFGSEKEQPSTEGGAAEEATASKPHEFTSRYCTDFEQLACLGKGGFGVVFEARNKMDDCSYAIKRILLPNSDAAMGRVMREVKALATLEHPGIVRYHQSWFESPPVGWQERRDRVCVDMPSPSGTATGGDVTTDVTTAGGDVATAGGDATPERPHAAATSRLQRRRAAAEHRRVGVDDVSSTCGVEFAVGSDTLDESASSFDVVFRDSGCRTSDDSDDERSRSTAGDCAVVDIPSSRSADRSASASRPTDLGGWRRPARPTDLGAARPRMFLYIQMQLCQRESLRDWLCANTLNRPRHRVLDIFHQITSAVDYVHSKGLMHRDLKPSNIFFSKDDTVKVGDFGLVTAVEDQRDACGGDPWRAASGRHTNQVGTRLYMSPEQMSGRNYTHKVDIFALGMILFELFYPFATQMERVKELTSVRQGYFSERFQRELPEECDLVERLVTATPASRPTAATVLGDPLLREFEAARVAVHRLRSSSRPRTTSSSSGNSIASLADH